VAKYTIGTVEHAVETECASFNCQATSNVRIKRRCRGPYFVNRELKTKL